jgi:hypothetical protein
LGSNGGPLIVFGGMLGGYCGHCGLSLGLLSLPLLFFSAGLQVQQKKRKLIDYVNVPQRLLCRRYYRRN